MQLRAGGDLERVEVVVVVSPMTGGLGCGLELLRTDLKVCGCARACLTSAVALPADHQNRVGQKYCESYLWSRPYCFAVALVAQAHVYCLQVIEEASLRREQQPLDHRVAMWVPNHSPFAHLLRATFRSPVLPAAAAHRVQAPAGLSHLPRPDDGLCVGLCKMQGPGLALPQPRRPDL